MRIALAQLNYTIGDFEGNLIKIETAIQKGIADGADLICFAELAICGYPPQDFLEFEDFIKRCTASIEAIRPLSHQIGIIIGCPVHNPVFEGKDLYNAALLLTDGKVQHVHHKALLPTYDIFDEYRYFEPATEFGVVTFKGSRIALTVCEDIWNVGNDNPLYRICPLDEMQSSLPELIINISASPFSYRQAELREQVIRANCLRYSIPMLYVNQIGAQTEILFDGGSIVMRPDGIVYDELPYFEECIRTYDLADIRRGNGPGRQKRDKIPLIHDALIMGIRDYFGKVGLRKAILGLSGGIDSALTAVLAVKALGPEAVTGLLMPSPFSSDHSIADARLLAENLGIEHHVIPIASVFDQMLLTMGPYFIGRESDVTEENIQARVRGMILMSWSNKYGHILLNTTNKSEMAVGYGTLYGDLCGGISVLGDVYKTEVYALSNWINTEQEVIPRNSIIKPPSAELRPGQKDTDSLPDYAELDPILFQYIECRKGPDDIIAQGHDPDTVRRVLRMVNRNEFKRYQTAPVLRVSPKSFGMGRRMPIVARYLE